MMNQISKTKTKRWCAKVSPMNFLAHFAINSRSASWYLPGPSQRRQQYSIHDRTCACFFFTCYRQAFDRGLTWCLVTMRSKMEHTWLEIAYSLWSWRHPNYIDTVEAAMPEWRRTACPEYSKLFSCNLCFGLDKLLKVEVGWKLHTEVM